MRNKREVVRNKREECPLQTAVMTSCHWRFAKEDSERTTSALTVILVEDVEHPRRRYRLAL